MARGDEMITGSVDEMAETIAAFSAEGINEVQVRLFPNDHATIERFARVIESVRAIEGTG